MFNNNRGGGNFTPRPKVQGNWKCGQDDPNNRGCGATITELPFEPTPGRAVYCLDCWKKNNPRKFDR